MLKGRRWFRSASISETEKTKQGKIYWSQQSVKTLQFIAASLDLKFDSFGLCRRATKAATDQQIQYKSFTIHSIKIITTKIEEQI